jgi:hypothetical protein
MALVDLKPAQAESMIVEKQISLLGAVIFDTN